MSMTAVIHMVGGGVVELTLDAVDLADVADRLRVERSLIGRLSDPQAGSLMGSEVLVPANRVQMIRWS